MLGYLYWNPDRIFIHVPVIDRPIAWYGLFFVGGFLIGFLIIRYLLAQQLQGRPDAKKLAHELADRLLWFAVAGTLVGARLGHVFFYDWTRYKDHLADIFKIWEGGLSSHGGTLGLLLAFWIFYLTIKKKYPELPFLRILDLVCIPTALVACMIRIGNFFNQEIIGTPSTLPWAVIFGDPIDGSAVVPRHPVQLYEGISYLVVFVLLFWLWEKRKADLAPGRVVGLFFVLVFGARFFLEFLKQPMEAIIDQSYLQMGQLLSLPFIALGVYLLMAKSRRENGLNAKAQRR